MMISNCTLTRQKLVQASIPFESERHHILFGNAYHDPFPLVLTGPTTVTNSFGIKWKRKG